MGKSSGTIVGVDAGASLAKLAILESGRLHTELLPADDPGRIQRRLLDLRPRRVGLTGGGAARLERHFPDASVRVDEFEAWGSGAQRLLGNPQAWKKEPYLLVSLGTGTSVMLVEDGVARRIGGTGLGGGTVMGLGTLLLRCDDFGVLTQLAARGDRRQVDLLVSDIYGPGEIPLGGDLTAANFGKPALDPRAGRRRREDLAHAIMGLVGENVALVCAGLAAASPAQRVVFGGSTLRGNPALREVLQQVTALLGRSALFLENGEFAGALGALGRAQG